MSRRALGAIYSVLVLAGGYALMKLTVPNQEQFMRSLPAQQAAALSGNLDDTKRKNADAIRAIQQSVGMLDLDRQSAQIFLVFLSTP
jgi:hypothetical protein